MPQTRPVILTTFANSFDAGYLAYLEQERDLVQQIIAPLPYLQHVDLPSVKTQQLVDMLNTFRTRLLVFHFGGHADGNQLHFKDTAGQVQGLAQLLALHPILQLVVLNGCNTQEQAVEYLNAGIPAVIATTCSVADGQAKQFAHDFYAALAAGQTLQEAFKRAIGAMKLSLGAIGGGEIFRGAHLKKEQVSEIPWRLYVTEDKALDWKLMEDKLASASNVMDIEGSKNYAFQQLHHSPVNIIHNYGLAPAPIPTTYSDEFQETLAHLSYKLNPPPEIYLVNCDRTNELLTMQDHREQAPGHQFYFILSCPSQHPHSLVQRYIFDIWDQFDQHAEHQIHYKRTHDFMGARRIDIQVVETGRKLDWLQKDWLAQVNKNEQLGFANFLEEELPQLNHIYLASAYEFFAREWPVQRLKPLLSQWLQSFSQTVTKGPQCLFFFILNIESIHCADQLSENEAHLVQCIQDLAAEYVEHTLVIDRLPQIELKDLQTWVDKMLEGGKRRNLFEIWCKKNAMKTGFQPDDRLDMLDVFAFIQELWQRGRQTSKSVSS